jgi:ACS family hexuronate transporter-like MFS transporter
MDELKTTPLSTPLPANDLREQSHLFSKAKLFAGRYRWVICALLLLGTTKNYMDRQVLGVLKDTLQHDLHWNEIDYGNLVFAFQAAYAIGILVVGRFIDRVSVRLGYACAMIFWSLASMGHALAYSLSGFMVTRIALGFGESGVFPASVKSVAEWFPQKERALATGIFNAGSNFGAILTPLFIPWITIHLGWRWAFIVCGGLGFFWVLLWRAVYRAPADHPQCTPEELKYIRDGQQEVTGKVPWLPLLRFPQTWAFILAKFLTDPIWWFYLFWVPGFLQKVHGVTLSKIGLPILTIYVISDVGSVAGGWFSSHLIKRGVSVNKSRKLAMLICALSATPIVLAYRVPQVWQAVLLIGLAAAAHQGFSANLFTATIDLFPKPAVASVVGIGGMAGAVGGMLIAKIVGYVLQWTGSYFVPFFIAGLAYITALLLIQLLAPSFTPAEIECA